MEPARHRGLRTAHLLLGGVLALLSAPARALPPEPAATAELPAPAEVEKPTPAPPVGKPLDVPWLAVGAVTSLVGGLLGAGGVAATFPLSLAMLPLAGLWMLGFGLAGAFLAWWVAGMFRRRVPLVPLLLAGVGGAVAAVVAASWFHVFGCALGLCSVTNDPTLTTERQRIYIFVASMLFQGMCALSLVSGGLAAGGLMGALVGSTGRAMRPEETGRYLDLLEVEDEVLPPPRRRRRRRRKPAVDEPAPRPRKRRPRRRTRKRATEDDAVTPTPEPGPAPAPQDPPW